MRKNKIDLYLYILTLLHNNFNKNKLYLEVISIPRIPQFPVEVL